MSEGYQYARLAKNGATVLYLAPVSEINEVLKNNLFAADRTEGRGTLLKNKRMYRHEITIQGEFVPTSDMQPDHRAAVQALYARSNVSAIQQYRWLRCLAIHVGGMYDLYLGDDAYSATSEAEMGFDIDGDSLPRVVIDEVRRSEDTRATRIGYTLKLIAGFERSTGEGA